MAVVLISRDLMGASRVEAAARSAGVAYRMVGSVDAAVGASSAMTTPLVIVDLAMTGIDVSALVDRLKGPGEVGTTILAFGPHVHEALLHAARDAGCDQVLTRGQFMSQLDAIIARFAGKQN
ncbi:MAG: hypothetical protein AB7G28_00280 [Pirellulales bacterium]